MYDQELSPPLSTQLFFAQASVHLIFESLRIIASGRQAPSTCTDKDEDL